MIRFRARDLAIVLVTAVATAVSTTVLVPVASDAAGSVFSLRDGKHAKRKATVAKNGSLKVGDGSGPLTVDGTVSTRPTVPGTPWNTVNGMTLSSGTTSGVLYGGEGNTKLYLSSFSAAGSGPNAGFVRVFLSVYVSDTLSDSCSNIGGGDFGAAERFSLTVPIGDTHQQVYPTPLVYSAYAEKGDRLCVVVSASSTSSGWSADIAAQGYLAP